MTQGGRWAGRKRGEVLGRTEGGGRRALHTGERYSLVCGSGMLPIHPQSPPTSTVGTPFLCSRARLGQVTALYMGTKASCKLNASSVAIRFKNAAATRQLQPPPLLLNSKSLRMAVQHMQDIEMAI